MHIQTETRESVLIWQINRPERRNALGTILAQELWEKTHALQKVLPPWHELPSSRPQTIRLLAIKVTPNKADRDPIWIAGGDLKELSQLTTPEEGRKYAETMTQVCQALTELPIPVVALIDGLVIGGGIEFALAADFRFATTRSRFHFKQLELGLATAYGSAQRLIQLIGVSKAMDWLLRTQILGAQEALRHGLIHETVGSPEDLDDALKRLTSQIERLPPQGVHAQKRMLHGRGPDTARTTDELDLFASLWMQTYHKERLKAFQGRT
ncbi:MAG: enoyl-CoA hydratase/isomerase family protein [Chitinophagaceae bacterium]|nr:enoyl-CoA hydratase/isomerase family protein [Oligoflexus sp.]